MKNNKENEEKKEIKIIFKIKVKENDI